MRLSKRLGILFLITACTFTTYSQQKSLELNGLIIDETNFPIPYAAVGIPSKYIGTASTEDGTFNLLLSKSNLADSLEVSSIGYETFKIKVQDFINQKDKTIIIKEDIVSLDEVKLLKSSDYVKLALKNRRKTTITTPHQLNILYRRFSEEDGKARFLVEHYMNVLDYGPQSGDFIGEEIVAGRKSADYRFLKKKMNGHPINVIT
ncbi:carboxypeptidase-like regulatory domain-containing protein, partial [Algibacter sp.]|uniref:carboxypeptidase-like regulatory domain-containing protein n=1 Tax=Algibacter sp. TaxID=1872428 RepID=UPI003C7852F2